MKKQTENETLPAVVEEPPERKTKIFALIAKILTVLILLLTILYCIAIRISIYKMIASGICILHWIFFRKNQKLAGEFLAVASLITLYFGFASLFPPMISGCHQLWKYPFQKFYISLYQNIKEPDYFPDFKNDVLSGYEFDYAPSILQGTGHYSVAFVTTPEKAKACQEIYSREAEYIIPLSGLQNNSYYPDEKNNDFSVAVFISTIWKASASGEFETEKNTEIYILSSNGDWNHPHTSAVIVDAQSGRIEFSQLG